MVSAAVTGLSSRIAFGVVMLLLAANGCKFDCRTKNFCGDVRFVNYTFNLPVNGFNLASPPQHALDLVGLGITEFAHGGLDCFFEDYPVQTDDDDSWFAQFSGQQTQAVLLDDNLLTEVPDMALFQGVQIVSLTNNTINKVDKATFTHFVGQDLIVFLQNNRISSIAEGAFSGFAGEYLSVYLANNNVTTLKNRTFAGYNGTILNVYLENNHLASIAEAAFAGFTGEEVNAHLEYNDISTLATGTFELSALLRMHLTNNRVTFLAEGGFRGFSGSEMFLYLNYNDLTFVEKGFLSGYGGTNLYLFLQHNNITTLEEGVFFGFDGDELAIDLNNNSITSFVDGTLSGIQAVDLFLDFQYNNVVSAGDIFTGFSGSTISVDFSNNFLTETSLQQMIFSFRSGAALLLNVSRNTISSLPDRLFNTKEQFFLELTLDLSYNPITTIGESVFAEGAFQSLNINFNNPTQSGVQIPDTFSFGATVWSQTNGGSFNFSFSHTKVNLSIVNALSGENGPKILALDLSYNEYSTVSSNTFSLARANVLNLSHNAITTISPQAFDYTRQLSVLDLSHNSITQVDSELLINTPALISMFISHNNIWALPQAGTPIVSVADAVDNILMCDGYTPTLVNCKCNSLAQYSSHCGYARCMSTVSGCLSPLFINTTNCEHAPRSACLPTCPRGQYHDRSAMTCLDITDCNTIYRNVSGDSVTTQQAYQVSNATLTTDRICSICSVCPDGYDTTECTPTTNSECVRSHALAPGDIASIVLTVLLLAASTFVAFVYGKTQSKKRNMTQGELEMTELLLGDVTEKHSRVEEEKQRMQQAWAIDEGDLRMHEVIGIGAFGTVHAGVWGHIPVAVKILRIPLDDLDPLMSEDFDREVTFMQSIRHPNLLTFYGGGVNSQQQAFLVTELMEGGSLRKLLLDVDHDLGWTQRLLFATDIARGMHYLHSKETLHRDLKADNCFLDAKLRVKVADFGTGKIQSKFEQGQSAEQDHSQEHLRSTAILERTGRTLTKGMGSLLWMAPEVLRGEKISSRDGAAIDIYSFGVVMWEIWARARPWDEVEGDGIQFTAKLTELVGQGQRPQLPQNCEDAPRGYATMMEQCWSTSPDDRPSFAVTLEHLESIPVE
eukprot:m.216423 g.216423  ORF g.216423 m.216423 type:complete len:1123 (+) comp33207_c7_seq3:167-3535(+)